jgi:hypothetical protein
MIRVRHGAYWWISLSIIFYLSPPIGDEDPK